MLQLTQREREYTKDMPRSKKRKGSNKTETPIAVPTRSTIGIKVSEKERMLRAEQEATAEADAVIARVLGASSESAKVLQLTPRTKRIDTRVGRKRDYNDATDDFEIELRRHNLTFTQLRKGADSYDNGVRSPYATLCHATLRWWLALPMSNRRVVWVDPESGFDERTVPEARTLEGKELIARGMVYIAWAKTRLELLRCREVVERLKEMTPTERAQSSLLFGIGMPGEPDGAE